MLSAVLRSKTAVKVSIEIINAFVEMRKLILDHAALFQRLNKVELKIQTLNQNQCTLCRLRHKELLDAAHIIADSEDSGEPIIQNGLSLCKIHHAAYDMHIPGITSDYIIKVRSDILNETDGPKLKYGIQSLENNKIFLPASRKDWPGKDRLQQCYENFLKAV